MYLHSIRFRDWKAYVDAVFEFPKPSRAKNVALIGAKNGYGKTSLLEGLILGLYGKDGLGLLARAVVHDGEQERLAQSYNDFLERALHARALEQGRSSTTVEIVLEEDADRLKIQRTWHFYGNGKHRRDQEEVRIWQGADEDPVKVPRFEDRDEFMRSFIAQKFLPVHLAPFFLFDGEQVQRLAKRDMASQVKVGIEGILGVRVLRELQEDLRSYAQNRRNSVQKIGDETLDRLRAEVREIEERLKSAHDERIELESKIAPIRSRRDGLTRDLATLTGGSSANLKELLENKGRSERERDRLKDRLAGLLRSDLAIAIAGGPLRSKLKARIEAEGERAQWLAGKEQSHEGLSKILASLDSTEPPLDPPLTALQLEVLRERIRVAWESLWHPPPARCADSYRHPYLGNAERGIVLGKLAHTEELALGDLRDLLTQIDETDKEIRKLSSRISELGGAEEQIKKLTDELDRLIQEERKLDEGIRDRQRQEQGDEGILAPKRQELARLTLSYQKAQPQLARSALADRIADLFDKVISDLYPLHVKRVSTELTNIYQELAHKKLVKSIEIDEDCTVRILGDKGRDLRTMDSSAGEDQIFALSLITAIARVSEARVPVVMDTPMARLDPQHRLNVLKYFTSKASEQVILLSQPEEVHGDYLKAIKDRVSAAYHLDHEEIGDGVGVNHVRKGYFEEI
jgi:DNA sulfur modification protein DndD